MQESLEAYWAAEYIVRNRVRVVRELTACYKRSHKNGRDPGEGDVRSWLESVYELASTLETADLGKVRMFAEYRVGTMDPIDVVLAGRHPDGRMSFAVIELKQWSSTIKRPDPSIRAGLCAQCRNAGQSALCRECALDKVCVGFPKKDRESGETTIEWKHKKHPAVQVNDNLNELRKHHYMFDDRYVNLVGMAYLHNLLREDLQWISNVSPRGDIPVFTARKPADLEKFLKTNFSPESGAEAVQALLERRRPNVLLTTEVGEIVRGHTRFSLVGNQLNAVNDIMDAVRQDPTPGVKKVFVVSGRAGTGKSLVALTLLGDATRGEREACYVSGGIASRDTFKRSSTGLGKAFVTLNNLAGSRGPDEIDLIVCDEAHRLSKYPRTGSFATRRDGESSVSVIVSRARVPVFFMDGDQRLFHDEIWTPDALSAEIRSLGAEVVPITLDRVLRTVGSATYDTWIQRLLAADPVPWDAGDPGDPDPFELYYADSAKKMEKFLHAKEDAGATARMTAGMCWKWEDSTGTVPEVQPEGDEGWARPWNAGDTHQTPGVPKRKYWATDPGGFGQIGCVHTAQGLEYEWGGVIIGPDLTWEHGRWAVHREAVRNKANRILSDDDLGRAIRNAYGVLMTRSIRGTVLYTVDPATRELFAALGLRKV